MSVTSRSQPSGYGPLLMTPRLDAKPWGGRRLATFGLVLPDGERVGEALITAGDARVAAGPYAGRTLDELVADDPLATSGGNGARATGDRPIFPLLIKLIDAAEDLSIQVHPNDDQAPAGSLGKTEAWHVLAAEAGAWLYLGLRDGVTHAELAERARRGESTADLMRRMPAEAGTTALLPAGTVHALGAGVLIYEIQQPSAVTYRFDDWGRVDAEGRGRELHVEQALSVLDPAQRPVAEAIPSRAAPRWPLVASAYFAAERIVLIPGQTTTVHADDSPQVLTCLSGHASVMTRGGYQALPSGASVVLMAADDSADLRSDRPTVLLRGWVPER